MCPKLVSLAVRTGNFSEGPYQFSPYAIFNILRETLAAVAHQGFVASTLLPIALCRRRGERKRGVGRFGPSGLEALGRL